MTTDPNITAVADTTAAAATTTAAADTTTTATTTAATDTTAAPVKADWPDDWRDKMAGDDAEFRKSLDRFNAPGDVGKSWKEISKKISSGEYKRPVTLPENATPEQIAEYRKEMGVPESPDKYDLKMDGLVIGEADKPVVDQFLKAMHEANVPEGPVKQAVSAYFKMQEQAVAQAAQAEREFKVQSEEALRQEWGGEYRPNMNLVENFAKTRFGDEVGSAMLEAGPEVVKALASIAREINPAMTLVPNASNPNQAIADEIAKLRGEIGTAEWMRNPQKQQRYAELIDGQARMQGR